MAATANRSVPGFLPSTSGFRFANDFPHVPVRHIGIPGVISIPIGDASNGLCGGTAFAARDSFEAQRSPPDDTTPPGSGPLFDYLCASLFDSFDLPVGPARYLELMSPLLWDGETIWSRIGIAPHGRAWQTVRDEWPRVRADIDAGHPSTLGLVKVVSSDPRQLKHDLSMSIADPSRFTPITTSPPNGPSTRSSRGDLCERQPAVVRDELPTSPSAPRTR